MQRTDEPPQISVLIRAAVACALVGEVGLEDAGRRPGQEVFVDDRLGHQSTAGDQVRHIARVPGGNSGTSDGAVGEEGPKRAVVIHPRVEVEGETRSQVEHTLSVVPEGGTTLVERRVGSSSDPTEV